MPKKSKNNNLDKYRKKRTKINTQLIKSAIAHIQNLSGEITFSSVSNVTYDLADMDKGEKGLTLSAISQNTLYRALVEDASDQQTFHKITPTKKNRSLGDINLMMHTFRVENQQLTREIKTLEIKLKEVNTNVQTIEPIRDEIIMMNNQLRDIAKAMVNQLCDLEITYIDLKNRDLVLSVYGTVIVHHDALEIFYKKELDAIKN